MPSFGALQFKNVESIVPKEIAVDYIKKKVFWLDTKLKHVGSVNFDGTNKKIVIR